MAHSNLELMRTLDDAWNAQDWETFEKRHSKDTTVSVSYTHLTLPTNREV